jgi:hypothetical protein
MSIIIALVIPLQGFLIYGDKRAQHTSRETVDNYVKVHRIGNKVACGITGHAEWGMLVISKLRNSIEIRPSQMIEIIKNVQVNSYVPSTITLGGIYDDGKPFLFTYRSSDKKYTFFQNDLHYSIASPDDKVADRCTSFFKTNIVMKKNIHMVFGETIRLGSELSDTISKTFDHIFIPL